HCQVNARGGIEVGDGVLIGPGAVIWSQNHVTDSPHKAIKDQGYEFSRVLIEDDVWIGAGAIVLPGVRLARGTVVAAGAVVAKSTEHYTVVAGVPARVVKRRSSQAGPTSANGHTSAEQDEPNPASSQAV